MLIVKPLSYLENQIFCTYLPQRIHPLSKTIRLLLCKVSNNYSRVRDFRTQLQVLSCNPGEMVPGNSTLRICNSGNSTVVSGRLIPFSATVIQDINFLTKLYHNTNLSYSAMNTARSALSLVIFPLEGGTFGNHPLVCRLLKGVFTTRPSLPRYQCIWDVAIVLKYLKTLHPPEDLHLRDLTWKVTMLIALLSGQRCQTIHTLDISDMQVVSQPNLQYVFQINKILKTSRPAKHFSHLVLQVYPADEQLCIFKTIQVSLAKGSHLKENTLNS